MTKKGFARSKSVDLKKAELFISGAETINELQIKESPPNEELESELKDETQKILNDVKTIKQQEKNNYRKNWQSIP